MLAGIAVEPQVTLQPEEEEGKGESCELNGSLSPPDTHRPDTHLPQLLPRICKLEQIQCNRPKLYFSCLEPDS